jgi:PAS domain-containing protein
VARKLQDQIESMEAKYRLIADNLPYAVWVVNVETLGYECMTPSIQSISGCTAEEIMGLTIRDRLTPESFARFWAVLQEEGGCDALGEIERAEPWGSSPSTRMAKGAGVKSRPNT